jgi:four helix bundle protein
MKELIKSNKDLKVYQLAYDAAMEIFEISKTFPKEERYSLTDQIRRSSRSVCSNIAEGFMKRRYPKSFILKLSDSQAEAAETQVWLNFALSCNYIQADFNQRLIETYNSIIFMEANMINNADKWAI